MRTYMTQSLLTMLLVCTAASFPTWAEDGKVQSLRGVDVAVPDAKVDNYHLFKQERDHGLIARNYAQQPPLIPHASENYRISKNFNKCLDCHAPSRIQETGATKVSPTHFRTRDGKQLSSISAQRYFCVQCHVSQTDAKPLVENTYRPASQSK